MKHYFDLIPISAKMHRKQNRMTKLCIILAVFLVTVIFSMADMEIRAQKIQAIQTDGIWHANFRQIEKEQAALIEKRPEVKCSSWYGAMNYRLNQGYQIQGMETVICGFDDTFLNMYPGQKIVEGKYPENAHSAVLTQSAKKHLGIHIGDQIMINTPDGGQYSYHISGFTGDTSMLTDKDALGMFLNMDGYEILAKHSSSNEKDSSFYVQFYEYVNIQKSLKEIRTQFGFKKQQIAQNTKYLALLFQSQDSYMVKLYITAAILSILVVVAGILMITASLNSNISQRTEFFGMMRCLGATKKQVVLFVRKEAFSWCRTAIPIGVGLAVIVVWGVCAMLRLLSPSLFAQMPILGISLFGILMGVLIGILTVLLAARAPAKKASKVSPVMAVSGNAGTIHMVKKSADTKKRKVETALGVHHAVGSKKNFVLMAGSFAFSIILFLSFSTAIDFMHHAIVPLKPYAPDISLASKKLECSLPMQLVDELEELSSVQKVYGRQFASQMPAVIDGKEMTVNLLSYENYQFAWAKDMLVNGSFDEAIKGKAVLAVCTTQKKRAFGNQVTLQGKKKTKKLPIAGEVSDCPYTRGAEGTTLICSEELFRELTGENGYAVIDVQVNSSVTEKDVEKIRSIVNQDVTVSDKRISNQDTKGAYYSFALFLYGFLVIISFISIFNVVNSIGMSVSARMKEYGVMRAVGMSEKQLVSMIFVEGLVYVVSGIILGCLIGVPVNRILFQFLVTSRWGDIWQVPLQEIGIAMLIAAFSLLLAIWGPSKRIREMAVVEIISEQ